nr:GDP-mannose mannosyl hydrolase [Paraglaciecola sp. L3A3]
MFLDDNTFSTVITSAPLVSIDLLVKNKQNQYLLGLRNNRPAKGYWFVPGGRILKDETIDAAFIRLTKEELGVTFERTDAVFLGPYEHFYKDYVFGTDTSTHYVVLAYTIVIDINLAELPNSQHCQYQWLSREDLLNSDSVHKHSKWYLE